MNQIDLLYEYLEESELGHLYDDFVNHQLSLEILCRAHLNDVALKLGISNKNDKRKLFEFLQIVKDTIVEIPKDQKELIFSPKNEKTVTLPEVIVEDQIIEEEKENVQDPQQTQFEPTKFEFSNIETLEREIPTFKHLETTNTSSPKDLKRKKQKSSSISVVVRKRPLNSKEKVDIITIESDYSLIVNEPKQRIDCTKYTEKHRFMFDEVFGENSSNEDVYARTAKPLVQHVFNRGYATCFAYGQTGSGKTYTMMGKGEVVGIYLLAATDIFASLEDDMQVFVSFFEIYGGKLFDLLNNRSKLAAREDGNSTVQIVGLKEFETESVQDLMNIMENGGRLRATGSTGANADSSRSHAILQITIKKQKQFHGKFTFVDLAGSERGVDTMDSSRQTRLEGAEINKSLLALKECIRSLDLNHKHIPFRGSKLTEVLKESFIGNSKTCMIANISPADRCSEHSLNTLRYSDRVKEYSKLTNDDDLKKQREERKKTELLFSPFKEKGNSPSVLATPKKNVKQALFEEPDLVMVHEALVNQILNEEEAILEFHRRKIESMSISLATESNLLKEVETPGSQIDSYISKLDTLLIQQIQQANTLRKMLGEFQQHLKEEEDLNKKLKNE